MKLIITIIFSFSFFAPELPDSRVLNAEFGNMLKRLLTHSVPEISVSSASSLSDSVLFLDAREKPEYSVSHLRNATWIGYDNFRFKRVKTIPKEKQIIVYCSVGYRSEKIAEKLIKKGYTNVSNLYGGIFEWKNQNHSVYKSSEVTNDVHPYDDNWGKWLTKGNKVYK